MSGTRTITIRLDNNVADEYERMANLGGVKPSSYIRSILTNNLYLANMQTEVSRVENMLVEHEKSMKKVLEKFTVENQFKEKYYEDVGGVYMMLIGILMKLNMEKDDIKNMQNRGTTYAQNNYIGKTE